MRRCLFEDIALIPALVTRCRRVGYVPQAFYNYYRRGGTISTTQTGDMVDIVKAFRKFLLTCHPAYRQEAVYSTARQLLWNMTQSRPLFFAGLHRPAPRVRGGLPLKPLPERWTGKPPSCWATWTPPWCPTCSSAPTAAGSCPRSCGRPSAATSPWRRCWSPGRAGWRGRRCRSICARRRSRAAGSMWRSTSPCWPCGSGAASSWRRRPCPSCA